MATRRRFTPEFKARVVLALISGAKSLAEVCRHLQLNSQVVTRWKSEFLEKAPQLFQTREQNSQQQARIGVLERLLDSGTGDSKKSLDHVEWQPEQKRAVVMKLADEYPVSPPASL